MKRLPETLTLSCILFGLLTSGTNVQRSGNPPGNEPIIQQIHDTTGLINLIRVEPFRLEIIPPSTGIQFYKGSIVFLSNTKYEGKMLPKHVSFGSIEAYTAMLKDTSLGFHMLFSPASSFSFPCEAITFSSDFKTMYFTRIGRKEKREKIYHAEYKQLDNTNSGWIVDENPLNFCSGDYIYTHPALSADGNIMIFASDMNTSLGGLDLFSVRKTGNIWSKPETLGKQINTAKYECYPSLDQDNNLYYSSDGLAGYGGYDIFTCKFNGATWDKPRNLSRKINSVNDDIALTIDKTDGKRAFYTSRHSNGNGEMQLFKVTLKQDTINNNPLSIAYIYNGKPWSEEEIVAVKSEVQANPPLKEVEKAASAEKKKAAQGKAAAATTAGSAAATTAAAAVVITITSPVPAELKDVVVYRIQFFSSSKPRKEKDIIINGVVYKTYEYLYLNSYRYTVGEFTTLPPARELQSLCRKYGYPQAFIAAFKGNLRSVDLARFK